MNSISAVAKTYRASNSYLVQLWWPKYSSTAASEVKIKIPDRIPRGPTDILKALEKTINYDHTGPSYKFFDDPQLAPYFDRQGRVYSLAKNAGRNAARWVRDEHPELFTQVISDPPVMSYMPSSPINENTVDENMLFQKICDAKVTDAIKVFEIMQKKKMDVSQDNKLALLELLCFYNCEDPTPMEDEAERYYGQSNKKDYSVNAWRDHPVVSDLFTSLQNLGSRPYSALICGLFKAGARAECDKLLLEAKEKKIKLDVNVYNVMIDRVINVYDKLEVKRDMVLDVLKEMKSEGVRPNLGTLNEAVNVISRYLFRGRYDLLVKLMVEFNHVGIKPSPGTFALIARCLIGKNMKDQRLLSFISSVLKSFEGQSLEIRHISDVLFFEWMMKACVVCESLPLAIQCLELFLYSQNRRLCGGGYKTSIFYNNFFQMLSLKGDFETLFKYYRMLVPHAHTPSPDFYTGLFETCDLNSAFKEFPELWKHYLGTSAFHEETISKMLEVAVNLTSLPDQEAFEARPIISDLAEKLILFMMDSGGVRVFERFVLTSEMCNHVIILLARGCHWRTIQAVLKFMSEKDFMPEENAVSHIIDLCYDHDNPNMAVWVLKFCHTTFDARLGLQPIASKLTKSDFLSQDLKNELKEVFKDDYSSSSSSSSSDSESSDSDDDSSDSEDISIPRKKKLEVPKPDITKVTK